MYNLLYEIGRYVIELASFAWGHTKFCVKVVWRCFFSAKILNPAISMITMRQLYFIGVELFVVMTFAALILGAIMVGGLTQLLILLNAKESIGALLAFVIVRIVAPFTVGILVILRSSTTFTMELSMMKNLGEFRTLEAMNIDLYDFVYFPRVLASLVSVMVLSTYFAFVSIIGGYTLLSFQLDTTLDTILRQVYYDITFSDMLSFMFKTSIIGFLAASIPIYTVINSKQEGMIDTMKSFIYGMIRLFFAFIIVIAIGEALL